MTALMLTLVLQATPLEDPLPAVARRLWMVSDVVLDQHIDSPARQELLLGCVKALRGSSPDLSRRLSQVTTLEQFTKVLRDMAPKDDTTAEQLQSLLLNGLLQRVPGNAGLLSAKDMEFLGQLHGNRYVGTGIQLGVHGKENLPRIIIAFPRGPARRAGARPNDLILEVDGVPVPREGGIVSKVVEMLRGPEGTAVSMTVRQPDSNEKRKLHMIRGVVPFETAVGYRRLSETAWDHRPVAGQPIAYIRLTDIKSSTLHELRQLENKLQADGFRALVLDLRLSGGGTIPDVAVVADGLLDGGLMWRMRNAQGTVKDFRADSDCLFRDWPMAVLVHDRLMGQTTQVLAGALQDNKRAVVIGTPTKAESYVNSTVTLPEELGTLRLRTGLLERAQSPRPVAQHRPPTHDRDVEGLEPAIGPLWRVVPDHVIQSDTLLQELQQWFHAQQTGDESIQPPKDPQLQKAYELLEAALKK